MSNEDEFETFYDYLIFISSSSFLHYGLHWWCVIFLCVGSILGVFYQLLSLALFSEIRLLGIEGVVCVVFVLGCEQLLAVCLDGRLVSSQKSKTINRAFMLVCVCLQLTSIKLHSGDVFVVLLNLNLQVKTIFSAVTRHRCATSCYWLAGVVAVTSSLGKWKLVFVVCFKGKCICLNLSHVCFASLMVLYKGTRILKNYLL